MLHLDCIYRHANQAKVVPYQRRAAEYKCLNYYIMCSRSYFSTCISSMNYARFQLNKVN